MKTPLDVESLRQKHLRLLASTDMSFIRYLFYTLPWGERLLAIKGARGIGKTTLMLQRIKAKYKTSEVALYISLDDLWFTSNTLSDLAEYFVNNGGKYLFIDEVHKYPNWSIEIKNLYDFYPELNLVFTGSSLLEIQNSRSDLSRRALIYEMQGMSLREYINFKTKSNYPVLRLEDILENATELSFEITKDIKPIMYFKQYLKMGYFPFAAKDELIFYKRLNEILNMIIEVELPLLRNTGISIINKMRKLLFIISESTPFKPNVSALSQRTEIARKTLLEYLHYLDEARVISSIRKSGKGKSALQKPDKIYLENPNYIYALAYDKPSVGNVRETFFLNQLRESNDVNYPEKGDFLVNEKYLFEVGGKGKGFDQIADEPNSYLALDDMANAVGNKIPLWLFGFLY